MFLFIVFRRFCDVVLHSLLFDVIPHPSVSYRQVFTPISYFQSSSSLSDSRHIHFNLSGPLCYSFTASATDLREPYLHSFPTFGTTCFYQGFRGSRQFFLECCRASHLGSKHRRGPSGCLNHTVFSRRYSSVGSI